MLAKKTRFMQQNLKYNGKKKNYYVAMNFSNPIALAVAHFALAVEPFALAVAPFALQDQSTIKDFFANLVWA